MDLNQYFTERMKRFDDWAARDDIKEYIDGPWASGYRYFLKVFGHGLYKFSITSRDRLRVELLSEEDHSPLEDFRYKWFDIEYDGLENYIQSEGSTPGPTPIGTHDNIDEKDIEFMQLLIVGLEPHP
jgi:hypothetical protein